MLVRYFFLLLSSIAVPRQKPTLNAPATGGEGSRRNPGRARRRAAGRKPDFNGQLAAIVEFSNDAIFSRDFKGTVTTWNAAAERIFGFSAAEIIGRPSQALLPPDCRDEFRTLLRRLRRGEVVEHFETERIRKDGQRIHVSLTLSQIREADGRIIGFSTIARDITEFRRMREAISRRERELDDLFEQASVGLVLVSPDGETLRANQAFLSVLEMPGGAVVGRPFHFCHPDKAGLAGMLERLKRRESLHNVATELATGKGETRHVLVDADGLWEDGVLVHSRWFVRDVSRRRQLERELLESSDRERRGFAQELHDGLGQQLGGIAYLSNVLRQRLETKQAPEAEAIAHIFRLVRKAIEDTRRMARGLSPIRESPEGLLEAIKELAAQTAELAGIRCRVKCPGRALVSDVAVAGHLYRIAQEAVNNAVKHSGARAIEIELRKAGRDITLMVSDDGTGIGLLPPNRPGLGLRIMKYRAFLINGTLEFKGRRPHGTTVACRVSLGPRGNKGGRNP